MAGPVTYSFADWIAAFPQFSACSDAQGLSYFNRATMMWPNSTTNPSFCGSGGGLATLKQLLYTLTSHIAWLSAPRDALGNPAATGAPAPSLVGRIGSATEGSVSVSVEWSGSGSPSEAWFTQTSFGAEFWQAAAAYRLARYRAMPTIVPDGAFPGGFGYYPRRFR